MYNEIMKKLPYFLIAVISLSAVLLLTLFFVFLYFILGLSAEPDTLFRLISRVDYDDLLQYFILIFFYLFTIDSLVLLIIKAVRKMNDSPKKEKTHGFFYHYWHDYRKVHLIFLLLAIFLTISLSAPSAIMNSFTAIVSISILVSNLTKKIEKE